MAKEISRREFVKKGSVGLAAGTVLMSTSAKSYANILGANDKINMAAIGIRGRGGGHIRSFSEMKDVHMKYLVDVDENQFERRLKEVEASLKRLDIDVIDLYQIHPCCIGKGRTVGFRQWTGRGKSQPQGALFRRVFPE